MDVSCIYINWKVSHVRFGLTGLQEFSGVCVSTPLILHIAIFLQEDVSSRNFGDCLSTPFVLHIVVFLLSVVSARNFVWRLFVNALCAAYCCIPV